MSINYHFDRRPILGVEYKVNTVAFYLNSKKERVLQIIDQTLYELS